MQKETKKPAIETAKRKIPAQLRGLFCEPPLLEGEDPELYWGLVAALIDQRQPETASDWIAVHDLVTKLWEERLLRRASNALVHGAMIDQLQYFFLVQVEERTPEERAMQWQLSIEKMQLDEERCEAAKRRARRYGVNPEETKKIRSLLAQSGMSEAELHANAFERKSDALQMFERMIAARERGRRKLRNEDDRRRRHADQRDEPKRGEKE
jgi:hypothetical protein